MFASMKELIFFIEEFRGRNIITFDESGVNINGVHVEKTYQSFVTFLVVNNFTKDYFINSEIIDSNVWLYAFKKSKQNETIKTTST